MQSVMRSSLASYGIGSSLVRFGVGGIETSIPIIRTDVTGLQEFKSAQPNSGGSVSGSFTSEGSNAIDSFQFPRQRQLITVTSIIFKTASAEIQTTSKVVQKVINSTPLRHRQQWGKSWW